MPNRGCGCLLTETIGQGQALLRRYSGQGQVRLVRLAAELLSTHGPSRDGISPSLTCCWVAEFFLFLPNNCHFPAVRLVPTLRGNVRASFRLVVTLP
jgi:hypothetical protein